MQNETKKQAERLKSARTAEGFDSATEAAELLGWSLPTYLSHENGTRGMKPDVMRRYASAFKISYAWLATGEGAMRGPGIDAQINQLDEATSKEVIATINGILAIARSKGRIS